MILEELVKFIKTEFSYLFDYYQFKLEHAEESGKYNETKINILKSPTCHLLFFAEAGIVIHPVDANADAFYRRFGFIPSPGREGQLTLLLKNARHLLRSGYRRSQE